uniref:Uncharacterized protein n=1 Tax=Rhizophora mucronata TaxID=61149 RepID=A0A2P2QIE0_RHIMU
MLPSGNDQLGTLSSKQLRQKLLINKRKYTGSRQTHTYCSHQPIFSLPRKWIGN